MEKLGIILQHNKPADVESNETSKPTHAPPHTGPASPFLS